MVDAPTPAGEAMAGLVMEGARRIGDYDPADLVHLESATLLREICRALLATESRIQAARLAGYAEGVEAAAKIADKYSNAGVEGFVTAGMIAREARSLTPPAGE